MRKTILLSLLYLISLASFAQIRTRPLKELINTSDPGWPGVQALIDSATHIVRVLPRDPIRADSTLLDLQVTTRSAMGAIIFETGGILIDGGWIRLLGSGDVLLTRTLSTWNRDLGIMLSGQRPGMLLVGDDAIGGFFILNGGDLGPDLGKSMSSIL